MRLKKLNFLFCFGLSLTEMKGFFEVRGRSMKITLFEDRKVLWKVVEFRDKFIKFWVQKFHCF